MNSLRRIRLDVFLHCTLGGFAKPPRDRPGEYYHPYRLERELWRLAAQPGRLPCGTLITLSERFGRSKGSLAALIHQHRRVLAAQHVAALYRKWAKKDPGHPGSSSLGRKREVSAPVIPRRV